MTSAPQLTPEQVRRYSRHIIMPQIGSRGQRKLIDSKVLIVGAGGLGGPVALYLALAGVGTLGLVDFDTVDLSNLQRQVLHNTDTIGMSKVASAQQTLARYNPEVNVVAHEFPINSENAMDLISQYDVIVNGADNFATRYLVNDAAYLNNKPLVDGSILIFDGQVTTYTPGEGCYRCLYPEPPPPGMVPNCAEAGQLAGNGSRQGHSWHRRATHRPSAASGCAEHGVPRSADAPQPRLLAVWRQPERH